MRTALIDGLGHDTWSTAVPVSLARTQPFQPNRPHYYSSACCAEDECTVHVPLRCLQFENKGRQRDRHTHTQTDRPSTVTLAHARRGLMKGDVGMSLHEKEGEQEDAYTETGNH